MAVTETTSASPASKGLKVGALGLLGSIVVGVPSAVRSAWATCCRGP